MEPLYLNGKNSKHTQNRKGGRWSPFLFLIPFEAVFLRHSKGSKLGSNFGLKFDQIPNEKPSCGYLNI